jgi:hemin uptake protein HemP
MKPEPAPLPEEPGIAPAAASCTLAQDGPMLHWPSSLLLRGRQVVCIEHKGAVYQLRLTRQDKLILTK